MIEYLVPGFIYSVAKDIWASFRPGRHKLDQTEILKRRMKWKGEFESRVSERYQKKLRSDVIIRDVERLDNYPDIDQNAKGISPWFGSVLSALTMRGFRLV